MPKFIDETGKRYGHWAVLKYLGSRRWLCLCVCGKEVAVDGPTLRNGRSTSCGCERKSHLSHGMARKKQVSVEWNTWSAIKRRCTNQKDKAFKHYGGRGIKICERWQKFENFFADMGTRPKGRYTIDRIDNNGPYSPENCRWADYKTQQRNRRSNRLITYAGKTKTLAEWSEITGIDSETISWRLKHGRSVKSALGF